MVKTWTLYAYNNSAHLACHKVESAISAIPTIDLFLGIGNTLVPSIGTQINIENLNIDMSSKTSLDHEDGGQCLVIDQREIKTEQGLVLGKVIYPKYYKNYGHKVSFFLLQHILTQKVHCKAKIDSSLNCMFITFLCKRNAV